MKICSIMSIDPYHSLSASSSSVLRFHTFVVFFIIAKFLTLRRIKIPGRIPILCCAACVTELVFDDAKDLLLHIIPFGLTHHQFIACQNEHWFNPFNTENVGATIDYRVGTSFIRVYNLVDSISWNIREPHGDITRSIFSLLRVALDTSQRLIWFLSCEAGVCYGHASWVRIGAIDRPYTWAVGPTEWLFFIDHHLVPCTSIFVDVERLDGLPKYLPWARRRGKCCQHP